MRAANGPARLARGMRVAHLTVPQSNGGPQGSELSAEIGGANRALAVRHFLSPRQIELVLKGGLINSMKDVLAGRA